MIYMRKNKTNISVIDNTGLRRNSNVIVGKTSNGYTSGDILDANAIKDVVNEAVATVVDSAPEALDTLKEIADITNTLTNCVNVTYYELGTLINTNKLQCGTWYRITDFVTMVDPSDSTIRSAEHPFDILVLALSNSKLSCDAYATQHDGDTYFQNSNLNAWKLKYSYFNSPQHSGDVDYGWADHSGSGKGVIYYMQDEFRNVAPYDFKNLQFKIGLKSIAQTGDTLWCNFNPSNNDTTSWLYTFQAAFGGDLTIANPDCRDNIIEWEDYSRIRKNIFHSAAWCNRIGKYSENNYIGAGSYNNTVTGYNNLIFNGCCRVNLTSAHGNIIKNGSSDIDIASNSSYVYDAPNVIIASHFIKIGESCYSNNFNNNCYDITLDCNCTDNTFNDGCHDIKLGKTCNGNIFGSSCDGCTFGTNCDGNKIGNNCIYIIFENGVYNVDLSLPRISNFYFESGIRNLKFKHLNRLDEGNNNYVNNYRILQGINQTSNVKEIMLTAYSQQYRTTLTGVNDHTEEVN